MSRRLAAVVLVAAFALAGCGGSSGVNSASYVKSICLTLSSWRNTVQAAGSQLQAATPDNKSVADAKHATLAFVASLLRATTTAATSLRAAGVPAVSGGKQVSTGLIDAFEGAQKALAGAASQASLMPTSSESAFVSAENQVTSSIRSALTSMNDVSPSTNPDLRKQIEAQPECSDLRAS
jgi:hypothetical protein